MFKIRFLHIAAALLLAQLIGTYLIGVGVWPQSVSWLMAGVLALAIVWLTSYQALLVVILSIPFYLVLPNTQFDTLSAWRPLFTWLFLVWFAKLAYAEYIRGKFKNMIISIWQQRFSWDKYIVLFGILALLSAVFAQFPEQSIKQLVFLANIFLIYPVAVNVVNSRERLIGLMKAVSVSLFIIVILGYVQYASTFFAEQYYFWQYWALLVSKAYYGLDLANILTYSNSWFSYTSSGPTLRMFSIMPDSHSFGVVCLLLMSYISAFLVGRKTTSTTKFIWLSLVLTAWALILSGTRGVWVGALGPIVFGLFMYWRKLARPQVKQFFIAFGIIVLFFVGSPLVSQGLNYIREGLGGGGYLQRVSSIYDLEEQSNAGRLVIWKHSLSHASLVGVGYGNFLVSFYDSIDSNDTYDSLGSKEDSRYNLPQKYVTAHSLYLNILVELGLVGLIIFSLIWLSYAKTAWRFLRQYDTEQNLFTGFAVTGSFALLWILTYGVFDLTLFNDKIMTYVVLSVAVLGLIFRNYRQFQQLPKIPKTKYE